MVIGRRAFVLQRRDLAVEAAVFGDREMLGLEEADPLPGLVAAVDQHRPQHRLFRRDVVRRRAKPGRRRQVMYKPLAHRPPLFSDPLTARPASRAGGGRRRRPGVHQEEMHSPPLLMVHRFLVNDNGWLAQ